MKNVLRLTSQHLLILHRLAFFISLCYINRKSNWGECYVLEKNKKRLAWLDIAKAFTIFLVVLGHTLRGSICQRIVYSFHVPTFFFLSGMTCRGDHFSKRIKSDFIRIMIPYYCFGIISILVFYFLGTFVAGKFDLAINTSLGGNLWELIFACPKGNRMKFNMPLWFLPCLFVTKLLYYVLYKLCKGSQIAVLLSSFACAILGFIYVRYIGIRLPFNISVALKMLAFFSLGRCFFLTLPLLEKVQFTRLKTLLSGTTILLITGIIATLSPKVNYSGDTFPNIVSFLATATLGCLGICFISMGIDSNKFLESIGQRTLSVLVMHKFPVLFFQTVGPFVSLLRYPDSFLGIASAAIISALAILLCIVAELLIRRICPFVFGDFSCLTYKKQTQTNS